MFELIELETIYIYFDQYLYLYAKLLTFMPKIIQDFILFLLLICSPFNLFAQSWNNINYGGRSLGIGNAAVALRGIDAAFSNQAGLAWIDLPSAIFYAGNRYTQVALFEFGAAFVSPIKNTGQFGISLHYFGEDGFNNQHIGLNYARLLFDKLAIGIQFDLLNTSIDQYGNRFAFTAEIGVLAEIFDHFFLGFHAYSPVAVELVPEESIPSVYNLGFSYTLSSWVNIYGSIEKNIDFPLSYKFGIEYNLHEKITVRGGFNTKPSKWTFGLGYHFSEQFRIDAGGTYHTQLGYSPGISFLYGRLH